MSDEAKVYTGNIENFAAAIKNAIIHGIFFDIDSNPTFEINTVPFEFLYCNSVSVITDKGNFRVMTAMTSQGIEGLWIQPLKETYHSQKYVTIESPVKRFEVKLGIDNLPFKISFDFELQSIHLYSGEIYDHPGNTLDYKINDEMILAFFDEKQAALFEKLANL